MDCALVKAAQSPPQSKHFLNSGEREESLKEEMLITKCALLQMASVPSTSAQKSL